MYVYVCVILATDPSRPAVDEGCTVPTDVLRVGAIRQCCSVEEVLVFSTHEIDLLLVYVCWLVSSSCLLLPTVSAHVCTCVCVRECVVCVCVCVCS